MFLSSLLIFFVFFTVDTSENYSYSHEYEAENNKILESERALQQCHEGRRNQLEPMCRG